jgi:LysM repeat protein
VAEGEGPTVWDVRDPADPIVDDDSTSLSWLAIDTRAAPRGPLDVCRFLAIDAGGGRFLEPIPEPDEANRCVALGDAAAQSIRQQELVCLSSGHRSCPRYLRGVLLEDAPPPAPTRPPVSRAVIGASLILVGAISASFGFLLLRGDLTLAITAPSPGASQVAVVPAATRTPNPAASPAPTIPPTASPTIAPNPSATPRPTPKPTPSPTKPPSTPTPKPTSDRYALLSPCPSTPNCWIYTIRAGDNLVSIAHYFGVPLDAVYQMNPWTRTNGIKAGDQLRLPPPTR